MFDQQALEFSEDEIRVSRDTLHEHDDELSGMQQTDAPLRREGEMTDKTQRIYF